MLRSVTEAARRPVPSNDTSRGRTRLTISDPQPAPVAAVREPEAGDAPGEQVEQVQQAAHPGARPSIASRLRSTPCQSGSAYATQRSTTGSDSTGKNTPENSDIGRIANRIRMAR